MNNTVFALLGLRIEEDLRMKSLAASGMVSEVDFAKYPKRMKLNFLLK